MEHAEFHEPSDLDSEDEEIIQSHIHYGLVHTQGFFDHGEDDLSKTKENVFDESRVPEERQPDLLQEDSRYTAAISGKKRKREDSETGDSSVHDGDSSTEADSSKEDHSSAEDDVVHVDEEENVNVPGKYKTAAESTEPTVATLRTKTLDLHATLNSGTTSLQLEKSEQHEEYTIDPDNVIEAGGLRYFAPDVDGEIKRRRPCSFCKQYGHKHQNCPLNQEQCLICGKQHSPTSCTVSRMICFSCGNLGHNRSDCPDKDRANNRRCDYCISLTRDLGRESLKQHPVSHSTLLCPFLWRKYTLKTLPTSSSSPSSSSTSPIRTKIRTKYCYNCGQKGHWGDDCKRWIYDRSNDLIKMGVRSRPFEETVISIWNHRVEDRNGEWPLRGGKEWGWKKEKSEKRSKKKEKNEKNDGKGNQSQSSQAHQASSSDKSSQEGSRKRQKTTHYTGSSASYSFSNTTKQYYPTYQSSSISTTTSMSYPPIPTQQPPMIQPFQQPQLQTYQQPQLQTYQQPMSLSFLPPQPQPPPPQPPTLPQFTFQQPYIQPQHNFTYGPSGWSYGDVTMSTGPMYNQRSR